MSKINKHIQIVRTKTVRQSSMGHKSCLMIYDVLRKHYETVGITYVANEADLAELVTLRPDLVFLGLKRTDSTDDLENEIWVSEYLSEHRVNYTGSTKTAISLDFNKNHAKDAVHNAGLTTARYFMAIPGQYKAVRDLPLKFPLFIKPSTEGGGKGIASDSIVRTFIEYKHKVAQIYQEFDSPALVETYLEGREYSVAVLGFDDKLLVMPIELIAESNENGDRILSSSMKSADTERAVAVAEGPVRERLVELAKKVYQELGARDYGRIDIRMDTQGSAHFLEANLIPGLANNDFTSYFTHACKLNGDLGYEDMILKIVETSLGRGEAENKEEILKDYGLLKPSFAQI